MKSISDIKPINTRILFQFIEDLNNHQFNNKTKSGLFVIENKENQINQHRWGEVIAIGPDVLEEDVRVGEYILIEALGWTNGMDFEIDGDKTTYWFTELEKVICVSDIKPELN